ncbi:excinuclease ABC subunit UvrB [Mycoplasmopsis opalescens]|uniref:excinuclease ABC subunit UvrB n=1 Tax=Mycoplasmopsis opalescens TaxID=114886 RepID=UPI0004A7404F|nr:excinuclease ABC subunit UvrB [Mycoplasmopsis opalescens]
MSIFKLSSLYQPAGDQPQAINELVLGIKSGEKYQVLKGVTGSGKTFTIANVIQHFDRPVLVLSHNKTLASQLYSELKGFFPENKVEYFVSYFDYYRPEAYIPSTDSYIDKTSKTNVDLDAMRMSAVNSILTRQDTIVVASVSAIYGALNPEEYGGQIFEIKVGQKFIPRDFARLLIQKNFERNDFEPNFGNFSLKGEVLYIHPAYTDEFLIRIDFFDDEIEAIKLVDPITKKVISNHEKFTIFPGDAYTVDNDVVAYAIEKIKAELAQRIKYFKDNNELLAAERIKERTERDLDSLAEFGICQGIENYARYMDKREENEPPYTLLDYFKGKDPLIVIDESHMMIPQLRAMFRGDRSRKQTLVDYGFRLPSALDNRPLRFEEFEQNYDYQTIYISATPAEYELDKTHGVITKLFVRPTGLLDPKIFIRPATSQVEDIFDELAKQKERNERTLILTTTKKMAEELSRFFQEKKLKVAYIHSEFNNFQRNEILRKLRRGVYDAVVGINLLREGIDLPEVSLIMVLDADKESFFRSTNSLIQIVGRAARNENGRVIFYANTISKSMQETIKDNEEKRALQQAYNQKHNIIPRTIIKPIPEPYKGEGIEASIDFFLNSKDEKAKKNKQTSKEKLIASLREQMNKAAKELDYEKAIELRDLILELQAK